MIKPSELTQLHLTSTHILMSSPMMTPEEAQKFKERWRLINEHTARAVRRRTPAQRLETLGRLYAAAKILRQRSRTVVDRQLTYSIWQNLRERERCPNQRSLLTKRI